MLYETSGIGKSLETRSRLAVACGWGLGVKWRVATDVCKVPSRDDENALH